MPLREQTVGIVGNGMVGNAIARGFLEAVKEVRIHDSNPVKSTHTMLEVMRSDFVFICVPTPPRHDGSCDTDIVRRVIVAVCSSFQDGHLDRIPHLVIKSTVPVGFTEEMAELMDGRNTPPALVHSPEFLTARHSVVDFQTATRHIVGVPVMFKEDATRIAHATQRDVLEMYRERFPGSHVMAMTSAESELVKLSINGFFAAKVLWFNIVHEIAAELGLCPDTVISGVVADGRVATSQTTVPGHDGKKGYGGACLPKDLDNLEDLADEKGLTQISELLQKMQQVNLHLREG